MSSYTLIEIRRNKLKDYFLIPNNKLIEDYIEFIENGIKISKKKVLSYNENTDENVDIFSFFFLLYSCFNVCPPIKEIMDEHEFKLYHPDKMYEDFVEFLNIINGIFSEFMKKEKPNTVSFSKHYIMDYSFF